MEVRTYSRRDGHRRSLLIGLGTISWKWHDSTGIKALGIIASPIAAMVGAYFGVQVSASAAKDAQQQAVKAQDDKTKAMTDRATAMGALDPKTATELRSLLHFQ
jgi:hypothetical protein